MSKAALSGIAGLVIGGAAVFAYTNLMPAPEMPAPAPMEAATAISADDAFTVREETMKALGGHLKALGAMAKGEAPMDASTAIHGQAVKELSHTVRFLFPEDSITDKSRAKPEIWMDWETFTKAATDLETASTALADASMGSDPAALGAALGGVGQTCGGCHKPFRGPEKE